MMVSLSGGVYLCFVLIADLVLLGLFIGNGLTVAIEFDCGSLTLSSMKLLGDAHFSNGSFRLTRDVGVPYSGDGKILYSKPVKFRRPGSESSASFSTFFSFSVTNLNPSSIGGGLAFVISPDDEYVGRAGGFLGAMDGEGSQKNVVAVEFDTLMDVEFKYINGNHVGLDLNSMVSSHVGDLDIVSVDLKSGDLVNAWVDYSGSTLAIQVYVSYSNLKPNDPILSADFDLYDYIVNDFMFVGFSGSTQGSTEIHSIEWWSFNSSFDNRQSYNSVLPGGASPPPPTANLINPTANTIQSPPPESNRSSNTSYEEKNDRDDKGDGKCHSKLCKSGPGAVAGIVTASTFLLGFCALALFRVYSKKIKPTP